MALLSCKVRDHRDSHGLGIWVGHTDYATDLNILANNPANTHYRVPDMSMVSGISITFMDGHSRWYRGTELEQVGNDHGNVKAWAVLPD